MIKNLNFFMYLCKDTLKLKSELKKLKIVKK